MSLPAEAALQAGVPRLHVAAPLSWGVRKVTLSNDGD
jgi:hypothetical protein